MLHWQFVVSRILRGMHVEKATGSVHLIGILLPVGKERKRVVGRQALSMGVPLQRGVLNQFAARGAWREPQLHERPKRLQRYPLLCSDPSPEAPKS